MAVVTDNWLENLQNIWSEISPLFTNLRTLDFKQLTAKDYLTLVGLSFTVVKSLFLGWQVIGAFKQYGVAKLVKPNLVRKYGTWAVVSAPEVGIGEAYCTELASCGVNILMVPASPEQCRPMAVYLEEKYKVKTFIAQIDFSNCRHIIEQIQEQAGDREVGILVNNLENPQNFEEEFTDLDQQTVSHIIHYTMLRTTMMTHLFLPGMIERGKGAIVTLAPSTVNMSPGQEALYGACKNFMDYFAKRLNEQYKDQGITVQTLLPLLVAQKGVQVPSAMSLLVPSASAYAKDAVCTLGWSHKSNGSLRIQLQAWLSSIMPSWMTKLIVEGLTMLVQKQAGDKLGIDLDDDAAKNFTSTILDSSSTNNPGSLLDYLIY